MVLGVIAVFLMTLLGTHCYIKYAKSNGLIDLPNQRSSHTVPTPRGGGCVFLAVWFCAVIVLWLLHDLSARTAILLLLPTCVLGVIGFLDDRMNLSAKYRFLCQLLLGIWVIYMLMPSLQLNFVFFSITSSWLVVICALFFILWSTNLFNFMDGTDGFAGMQACVMLLPMAFLLWQKDPAFSYILILLAVGVIGFLCFNWPKAKVFMGDVGSATLGFLLIVFALYSQQHDQMPMLIWVMLYGVFLFDATVTLLRRLWHKQRWYEAHKLHAYQRLHQSGFSHAMVLCATTLLNILIIALAMLAHFYVKWVGCFFLIECLLLIAYYLWVERRCPFRIEGEKG